MLGWDRLVKRKCLGMHGTQHSVSIQSVTIFWPLCVMRDYLFYFKKRVILQRRLTVLCHFFQQVFSELINRLMDEPGNTNQSLVCGQCYRTFYGLNL